MIKKSLLIGSAVSLASSPLLVAQKDILIFGNDTLAGGQNVSASGTASYWRGDNTGVIITSLAPSGMIENMSSQASLSDKTGWSDDSPAVSVLSSATGISSTTELDGIKSGLWYPAPAGQDIPQLHFAGFNKGQEYEITLWVKTLGPVGRSDLNIAVSSSTGVIDGTVFTGLYNSSQSEEKSLGSVVLGKQGDYVVRYSFTAGEGVNFQLLFSSPEGSDGNAGRPFFDIGLIAIAAVPEPSAFGLLAGVGALALTVSRRKRSRRS